MNITHHLDLLLKLDRSFALKRAIESAVKPGDTVLDLGCGSGILSFWAVKAGASKVIAVDLSDLTLAKRLAHENNLSEAIEFRRDDIANINIQNNSIDVLMGMIYYNDPRRDETQSFLFESTKKRVLKSSGLMIPNLIRYYAYAVEWPEQNINRNYDIIQSKVEKIEKHLNLSFKSLSDLIVNNPSPSWFPIREPGGLLTKTGAITLTSKNLITEIDYQKTFSGYADNFNLQFIQEGTPNAIIFIQELYYDGNLIFSNESASWIINPALVRENQTARFELDNHWRNRNTLKLSISNT